MLFAHDTELGLLEVAALVNTTGDGREELPDIAALDAFVRTWGWTGRRDRDEAELRAVHALRPRLRELWAADEDRVVAIVNQLLRDGHALPQLVKHDGWDYHLHATPSDAPLATRMAVDAAMAILELVRTKELSRLRICEYPGCNSVVVDLSKNRSKRYCEGSCSNRAAVAAYRARKADRGAAELRGKRAGRPAERPRRR
ncbi:MAG TPA: CGNR zinc finger domain-containing protein [Kofleriaceae bacterium]|nr:CGNR zinc finger domain-containing protein [Kofleriaceae bacterium]